MAKFYANRMATVGHPRHAYTGRVSMFWVLPMLLVLGFITFIFLYKWQNAQTATVPTVHVSTPGAPWASGGLNGQ